MSSVLVVIFKISHSFNFTSGDEEKEATIKEESQSDTIQSECSNEFKDIKAVHLTSSSSSRNLIMISAPACIIDKFNCSDSNNLGPGWNKWLIKLE